MKLPKGKNLIISGALLLLGAALLLAAAGLPRSQQSQFQAERWAGESGERFAQLTVILPEGTALTESDVLSFRQKAAEKLASPEQETSSFCDAWSARGSMKLDGPRGSFDAAAYAVGGRYFDFHPMTLESGGYLAESDLMKDRLVLDTRLAWLLFGSTDVTGMTVTAGDAEYYVAGVVTADADPAAADAPTVYLPYEAREAMTGSSAVSFETVLPERVKGFAAETAEACFPLKGTTVQNTGRFSFVNSMKLLRRMSSLGTRTAAVVYPDWENAAIRTEFRCAVLRLAALLALLFPGVLCLVILVRGLRLGFALARRSAGKLWQWGLERRDDRLERRQARHRKEGK